MSEYTLKDTLVAYDAFAVDFDKLVQPELRAVDDGQGCRIVEFRHGENPWHAVARLQRDEDGLITVVPVNNVRLHGSIPLGRSPNEELVIEALRASLRLPTAEPQHMSDKSLGLALTGVLRSFNRMACESGSLEGYAQALLMAWGALIAEDVKGGMLNVHVIEFTKLALKSAETLCEAREREERRKEVISMLAGDFIKDLVQQSMSKADDKSEEPPAPPMH